MVIYEGEEDGTVRGMCQATQRVQDWKEKKTNYILMMAVRIITKKILKEAENSPNLRSLLYNSSYYSYINGISYFSTQEIVKLTTLLLITFDKTSLAFDTRPDITIRDYLPRCVLNKIDNTDRSEIYGNIKNVFRVYYRMLLKNMIDINQKQINYF